MRVPRKSPRGQAADKIPNEPWLDGVPARDPEFHLPVPTQGMADA